MSTIGTASRDYSTIQAWEDAFATTLTSDQLGECYNDSEFSEAISFSGVTYGAYKATLTCAAGESFQDDAGIPSNALKYDQTKGVGITKTTTYSTLLYVASNQVVDLQGLQLKMGSAGGTNVCIYTDSSSTVNIDDCIIEQSDDSNGVFLYDSGTVMTNSVVINKSTTNGVATWTASELHNCTIAKPGSSASGTGVSVGSSGTICKNVASFGFSTGFGGTFGTSSNNATDDSTAPGTSNQTSLTYADQFQDTGASTYDYRAVGTGSLDGNGVRDQTYTSDLDIYGQSRSTSTPTIGAFEVVAAAGGTTVIRLAGDGGLAGKGGLAGRHGGLAG